MIGVVSRKNGRVLPQRRAERRARTGAAARARGRAAPPARSVFCSVVRRLRRARRGTARSAARSDASSRREGLEVRVRGVHQRGELLVALAPARSRAAGSCGSRAVMLLRRFDQRPRDLRAVAGRRLEALEDLAQVLRGGLLEALVGAGGLVVEGRAARVEQDLRGRRACRCRAARGPRRRSRPGSVFATFTRPPSGSSPALACPGRAPGTCP